jgi:[acyl-carrier-protein] S-malonyltransferase
VNTALVFPGMGPTRFAEVGRFLIANPGARRLLSRAGEVLGYDVVDRFADAGDAGDDYDEAAQVAFLVTCLALAEWAQAELGVRPDLCAGPSFGAKTVTGFTGALCFEDTVLLTARLARIIDAYIAAAHPDVVTLSFVRAPMSRLGPILSELTDQGEWYDLACEVDDGFYLLNLREHRAQWLAERLRAAGALPLYTMRPPMHSRLFQGLRDQVEREVLPAFSFADPAVPIVSDQTGAVLRSAAEVRALLLDGLLWPVRWPGVTAAFSAASVSRVVVAGPDSMFGRVDCVTRNFEVLAVDHRLAMRPVRARAGAR